MKHLLLWRHGEAGNARTDLERELTEYGQAQAQRTAQWLHAQNLDLTVISSQAQRTQQTAGFYKQPDAVCAQINPGTAIDAVLAFIEAQTAEQLLVVGHQSWVGQVVSYYLTGEKDYLALNTSDLWWLQCDEAGHWTLKEKYVS
ncbi:SixA phosphatase family protein [Rappaport israeli]|uniref:SixA phosphatase family protein n=1 Tax=Rappaport israeli TaxID=1839807 RepID=UPI000930E721|nr:histidine phosphatase family protein [Rappaport israeli]